ncbi:hypothetical protein NOZ03_005137, partial [Klebsiella pneumoniae]
LQRNRRYWHYAFLGNPHYCSGPHSPTTIDNGAIPHVHLNSAHRELSSKSQFKLINSSYVLRPLSLWPFFYFNLQNEMDLKIMVTITKGVQTYDGKIPVTLLVDDVETANTLVKMAKDANVTVIEQDEDINKSAINPVFKHLDKIASKK